MVSFEASKVSVLKKRGLFFYKKKSVERVGLNLEERSYVLLLGVSGGTRYMLAFQHQFEALEVKNKKSRALIM